MLRVGEWQNPKHYTIDAQGVVRTTNIDNGESAAYVLVHQWNRAPGAIQRGIRRAYGALSVLLTS